MAFFFGERSGRDAPHRPTPIGIDGIPEATALLQTSCIYAIRIPHLEVRRLFLARTAANALANGNTTMIVSPRPQSVLDHLEKVGQPVDSLMKSGRLRLCKPIDELTAPIGDGHSEQFAKELEDIEIASGSLLLFDGADPLIDWDDCELAVEQARTLRHLTDDLGITSVFLFASSGNRSFNPNTLNHLAPWFAGIAELASDDGRLTWMLRLWETSQGTVSDRQFGVSLLSDFSGLVADGLEIESRTGRLVKAPDENRVIVTADSISGENAVPDFWEIVPDYAAALAAAEGGMAATVILHYGQTSELPELAKTIHRLRRGVGRGLKIIVRVRRQNLRYNQELLVRRAGANEVVYRGQRFARLATTVEALHNECFTDPMLDDLDAALDAVLPQSVRGYLPVWKFCARVEQTLSRSEAIALQHVLVRLPLRIEATHLDALLAWQPERDNDVLTATESDVYVFLFACRESDIDAALQRMSNAHIDAFFGRQKRFHHRAAILAELRDLAGRAEKHPFVDYSLALPRHDRERKPDDESSHAVISRAPRHPTRGKLSAPPTQESATTLTPRCEAETSAGASPRTVTRGSVSVRRIRTPALR